MEIRRTITSIFMVPTLKIPKDTLKFNGFINAYVNDVDREEEYKDSIYLLFKPDNLNRFREFLENEYERTKAVIDDYDYDGGYIIVVYQLDTNLNNDFSYIKKGKYSKTSTQFQSLFPKLIKIIRQDYPRDEISLQYRIFNRTEDLINFWEEKLGVNMRKLIGHDFEVWNGFETEKEILDITKIKENE